jgi:predicted nuclease of predicted toxin-antitoxin system
MKLLIDMNLSPNWVGVFKRNNWEALHWSTVGDPRATDRAIMDIRNVIKLYFYKPQNIEQGMSK